MQLRLGIDVACRAAHQGSLADETGQDFRTRAEDLEQLWAMLPEEAAPADVLVIMEPTRNAWVPLAAWFRRRGGRVVLVPLGRSAGLRAYYRKHARPIASTRVGWRGCRCCTRRGCTTGMASGRGIPCGARPGCGRPSSRGDDVAGRARRALELLGPAWLAACGADLANKTPLRFLAAGDASPDTVKRLGQARIARFLYRHSRGAWGQRRAAKLLAAAEEALARWERELDYQQLAEDIAVEARLALYLTQEIAALDERIALQFEEADPNAILTSAPGIGAITGAQILGPLGDPNRFRSLAGVRSFSGLVPSLDASGVSERHGGQARAGDASFRETIFIAADHARRIDPTLAARYHRLMVTAGKHHNSALSHVATARSLASWPAGGAASATSSATVTAGQSPWRRGGRSSPSATPCPWSSAAAAARRAVPEVDRGRAGVVRSRSALRRRARPLVTLQPQLPLDTDWDLNGPEFARRALDQWAHFNQVELDFSRPAKPMDNAFIESFNARLRQEPLNASWFLSLADARECTEAWRKEYQQGATALIARGPLTSREFVEEAGESPKTRIAPGIRSGAGPAGGFLPPSLLSF